MKLQLRSEFAGLAVKRRDRDNDVLLTEKSEAI